jgi:hypothetical protein
VYKAKNQSDKEEYVYKGKTPSSSYSLSDAHIFLPAAGYRDDGGLLFRHAGSYGYYWSSSLGSGYLGSALYGLLYSGYVSFSGSSGSGSSRYHGQPVRAVIPGE